jgi:hypothetical protein
MPKQVVICDFRCHKRESQLDHHSSQHLMRNAAERAQRQRIVCAYKSQPKTDAAIDGDVVPPRVKLHRERQPQVHLDDTDGNPSRKLCALSTALGLLCRLSVYTGQCHLLLTTTITTVYASVPVAQMSMIWPLLLTADFADRASVGT